MRQRGCPALPVGDDLHPRSVQDHSWGGSPPKPPSSVEPPLVYNYTLKESPQPPRQTPESDFIQSGFLPYDVLETIEEITPPLAPKTPLLDQKAAMS